MFLKYCIGVSNSLLHKYCSEVKTSLFRKYCSQVRTMSLTHLVFVYGTLKTGEPNHKCMNEDASGLCVSKGIAYTKEKYPLVVASRYYTPYLLDKHCTGHHVEGELYEVDDAQLERLDRLENHPKYYIRQPVTLTTTRGGSGSEADTEITAESYFLVKFRPELLQLKMYDSYKDGEDGNNYVMHKDRDTPTPLWWYEVHTEYEKPDT